MTAKYLEWDRQKKPKGQKPNCPILPLWCRHHQIFSVSPVMWWGRRRKEEEKPGRPGRKDSRREIKREREIATFFSAKKGIIEMLRGVKRDRLREKREEVKWGSPLEKGRVQSRLRDSVKERWREVKCKLSLSPITEELFVPERAREKRSCC